MLKWLAAATVAFVCAPAFADDDYCLVGLNGHCYVHGRSMGVTKGDFTAVVTSALVVSMVNMNVQ